VPRPRIHELDDLLDAGEDLLAQGGSMALTIRAVAERVGASTGTIYHAFPSRNALLGHMWLRAANRFLALQRAALEEHLGDGRASHGAAVAATVAAAGTLAALREVAPKSAQLLIDHRRETLIGGALPDQLRAELLDLDVQLLRVLRELADALFGRHDRRAVEVVAVCVVDLPTGLLSEPRVRAIDPVIALDAAVRGVLACDRRLLASPPGRRRGSRAGRRS
jgi:AcrR family transcriptional regulator